MEKHRQIQKTLVLESNSDFARLPNYCYYAINHCGLKGQIKISPKLWFIMFSHLEEMVQVWLICEAS